VSRNATLLLRWYGTEISSLLNIAKSTKLVGECWSDEIAPTLAPLGEKFPQAQFVVTGVLGPHSNAHGPNEFLHIPTGKRVSVVIAQCWPIIIFSRVAISPDLVIPFTIGAVSAEPILEGTEP